MIYKVKLIVAFTIMCLLIFNKILAGQNMTKTQISTAIENARTGATPDIRQQAVEQLVKLTRKINSKDIDDETLNDFLELLDIPEARRGVSIIFENLESREKSVAPKLIQLLIVKARTGETALGRNQAGVQLVLSTSRIKPENIDDKTLNDIIALLDIPEDGVSSLAARSLGSLGVRAKIAAPKLAQLLITEECSYQDLWLYPKLSIADSIRAALKRMGVEPPPPLVRQECEALFPQIIGLE